MRMFYRLQNYHKSPSSSSQFVDSMSLYVYCADIFVSVICQICCIELSLPWKHKDFTIKSPYFKHLMISLHFTLQKT